jgi:hypothetical protein
VDTRADINDVYCFASPETPGNTVIVVTVCPLAGITAPDEFTPNVKYEIAIDVADAAGTFDQKEDQVYSFTFGKTNKDGKQSFTVAGPKRNNKARGTTEDTNVKVGTAGKAFCGNRDDPFFFDLIAFRRGLAFSAEVAKNFFDGVNTKAIVLEVPTTTFNGTKVGVWARTLKGRKQIDRMGRPAINTVLIAAANKDRFNSAKPVNDVRDFTGDATTVLMALGNTAQEAADLAAFLLPDIMTYDSADAGGFPNGRKLDDDAIDIELNLLSKGVVPTDFVGNDSTFLTVFPYLGVKN